MSRFHPAKTEDEYRAEPVDRKLYNELRRQRDQLLSAAKAALNYAGMDAFLDSPGNKANHVFGIRKEHLKALRAAIAAVETPKPQAAD